MRWIIIFCVLTSWARDPKIGAFNIQIYGKTKAQNSRLVKILAKIITRYDVIFVQEIRDLSGGAIRTLYRAVKKLNSNYEMKESYPMGDIVKETYLYFYRADRIRVMREETEVDRRNKFLRPPYLLHVRWNKTGQDFALIGHHASPDYVAKELTALAAVAKKYIKRWREKDIIILGDLNADCRYLAQRSLNKNKLYRKPFVWHISLDTDTTTSNTDCAYDHFITTKALSPYVKSAKPYRFDKAYRLSQDMVRKISDHYPVEMTLQLSRMP